MMTFWFTTTAPPTVSQLYLKDYEVFQKNYMAIRSPNLDEFVITRISIDLFY